MIAGSSMILFLFYSSLSNVALQSKNWYFLVFKHVWRYERRHIWKVIKYLKPQMCVSDTNKIRLWLKYLTKRIKCHWQQNNEKIYIQKFSYPKWKLHSLLQLFLLYLVTCYFFMLTKNIQKRNLKTIFVWIINHFLIATFIKGKWLPKQFNSNPFE